MRTAVVVFRRRTRLTMGTSVVSYRCEKIAGKERSGDDGKKTSHRKQMRYIVKSAIGKSIIVAIMILVAATGSLFAQVIDRPAATVNLNKNEFISVSQLEQRIEQYKTLGAQGISGIPTEPLEVLDTMIQEVLIRQAAENALEKGHIYVSDEQVNAQLNAIRQDLDRQQGSPISDRQFEEVVVRDTGMSLDAYKKQIRDQLINQEYIRYAKQDVLSSIPEPTEKQIEAQYRKNATSFTNPELVRINEVFIDTRGLSSENKQKARERAELALRQIRNGEITFEEAVLQYSDDSQSRYTGGEKGFFARNDPRAQAYGDDYIDAIFEVDEGKMSGIIQSKIGYHVVKVTDHRDPKLLTLDDPINPLEQQTVRGFIKELLMQELQSRALQQAIDELTEEFEEKAEVRIFTENVEEIE